MWNCCEGIPEEKRNTPGDNPARHTARRLYISSQALSGGAGFLTNFILNVREPISKAATAAGDLLEGIYGYVFRYEELQAENEALRIQLAEAQEAAREGSEAVEENRRYETLLGFAATTPTTSWSRLASPPGARTTGRASSR